MVFDGIIKIALAEAERRNIRNVCLPFLDESLMMCERTGHRVFECELHRVVIFLSIAIRRTRSVEYVSFYFQSQGGGMPSLA